MNKQELIAVAAEKAGLTKKDVEKSLKALVESIVAEVAKKGKVQLIGFGTFEARNRKASKRQNHQNKQRTEVAAHNEINIKCSK